MEGKGRNDERLRGGGDEMNGEGREVGTWEKAKEKEKEEMGVVLYRASSRKVG